MGIRWIESENRFVYRKRAKRVSQTGGDNVLDVLRPRGGRDEVERAIQSQQLSAEVVFQL